MGTVTCKIMSPKKSSQLSGKISYSNRKGKSCEPRENSIEDAQYPFWLKGEDNTLVEPFLCNSSVFYRLR